MSPVESPPCAPDPPRAGGVGGAGFIISVQKRAETVLPHFTELGPWAVWIQSHCFFRDTMLPDQKIVHLMNFPVNLVQGHAGLFPVFLIVI